MEILQEITLDFALIKGKAYPRINIIGLQRPSTYGPDDFFIIEKYTIDRGDLDQLSQAKKAEKYQAILYYMSGRLYMFSYIYMGGYDLGIEPEIIDIKEYIEKGIARLVDTETDTGRFLYIYRVSYKSFSDAGASSHVLGVEVATTKGEAGTGDFSGLGAAQYAITRGLGSLYRPNRDGIIVEKGIPMVHVGQRFHGPIEGPKENARRTAMLGTQEYLDETMDSMVESAEAFYADLVEFGDRIVGSTGGVGVALLTPEFDYYMNQFLFMDNEGYMNDGSA